MFENLVAYTCVCMYKESKFNRFLCFRCVYEIFVNERNTTKSTSSSHQKREREREKERLRVCVKVQRVNYIMYVCVCVCVLNTISVPKKYATVLVLLTTKQWISS